MKTSARSIAQTTKYRTPSVWNPLAAVRHREESWFYFPEPSLVFKKEEEGEEQDNQMFSLLFQLLNYDFSSKNQYFLKLEMQPLLQELRVVMAHGAREEKIILEKINQMLLEILRLKEVHENSTFWLSHVETMKQEANVLLERLVKKQSVLHSSVHVSQDTKYQLRNWVLRPVTQIQENVSQKITAYENRIHRPLVSSEKLLMTERWKNDVHHLRTIYESMSKEEKEFFLQEISLTETELLSTQNMTREQWEVFLTKSLPLISVYAKKQDENVREQEVQSHEDILQEVSNFTDVQWQNLKLILTKNVSGDYENLYSYFKTEHQEHHDSHENWIQEKQDFVAYIQKNQYTSLLKSFLLNAEIMNNTVLLAGKGKNPEAERMSSPEKSGTVLTDWISHLTRNQWQEEQNVYDSMVESYATPQLESVQVKSPAEQQILTEEIQRLQKYVQKNRISDSKSMESRTPSLNALEEYRLFNGQQMSSHKLSPDHWRQEVQQFYHMYQSMAAEEKEVFLREISVTESELLSIQKMTKEQWEVFFIHTLPLISSFVKKQEEMQTVKETAYKKKFLHHLEKFVETQQQKSNLVQSQNEHTDVRNLRIISDLKSQETTSILRNQIKQTLSLNKHRRTLEEIFLEPIGLHRKNENILENRQIYRFGRTIDTLATKHWKHDLQQFVTAYQSMETEEKEMFLQELSMTELEIRAVQIMSKEQWEVFLTNAMPLISSYIQKQEEQQTTQETVRQKELIRQLKELEKIQQQNLKSMSIRNEQFTSEDNHIFSKTTNHMVSELFRNQKLENHQISLLQKSSGTLTTERWQRNLRQFYQIYESMEMEEKTQFLESLSMTETEMLSVRKMTKDQWEVFLTNVLPLISSYVKKQEEVQKTQQLLQENEFLRVVNELTETQWQALKSLLVSEQQTDFQNLRSFFHEIQQAHQVSTQNWVKEKQAFAEYVQKHQYISLAHSVLTDFIKTEQKEHFVETKEDQRYSEKTLHETAERLAEWFSYLTETQWEEIRDVFTENSENAIIKPILEMMEQQRPAPEEPLFSSEKRGLISYLAEHTDKSVEIIRMIQNRESLKSSMENWVSLPPEEKVSKENVVLQEVEQTFTDEQIQDTAENLTEWISYLTENQWEEIKSVLTIHQNEAYISPLLEIVNHQEPFEMEPDFSAEKRGAMIYISQNKQASTELIKILMDQKTIENNLSEWVDLTPWKKAQEKTSKESKEATVSLLENAAKNNIVALTKFMSVLTESQWRELRETATKQQRYQHLQPLLTFSKTQEEYNSFEAEKKTWMDHITESQAAASEFLNLIRENRNVNLIFQDIRQKAETESRTVFEKSVKTQVSQRMAEEQKRAVGKMTVQRMINWLQQAESEQNAMPGQSLKNGMNHQTIFLQNQTGSHNLPNTLQRNRSVGNSNYVFNQQGNMRNQIMSNGTLLQTIHHFSGVMNQDAPENALLQPDSYGTAQMVVVKKTQGNTAVQAPPKIPEVILEAKKAMQTEVHDIITRKRSQEPEQTDNKTVLELIRRLDVQQKEIEKIRSTQKQMLNITDISVVTEKVMNQMQSQLRLEKMRRGL